MDNLENKFKGILLVGVIALIATLISKLNFFENLAISPLIIGILLGMIYANTFKKSIPAPWHDGILFCTKTLLRIAIVFYGFRLTLKGIYAIGLDGIFISILVVALTFLLGNFIGVKILKMDKDLVTLTSIGSAICGAAAVLASEPIIKAKPYKSAIAVSTVVLFGTISMFLYPIIYRLGITPFGPEVFAIYLGGTLHEVAHVVGASGGISEEVAKYAIVVKMTRVMALAPFLMILSYFLHKKEVKHAKTKIKFPLFALMFIVVVLFNSLDLLPNTAIKTINILDNFALTMAMSALGMESGFDKFKQAGLEPFLLALCLFIWLVLGGFVLVYLIVY